MKISINSDESTELTKALIEILKSKDACFNTSIKCKEAQTEWNLHQINRIHHLDY